MPDDEKDFQAQNDLNVLEMAEQIESNPSRMANVKDLAVRIAKRVSDLNVDEADAVIERMKTSGHTTMTAKDVGM